MMTTHQLQAVADQVVRRAQGQGSILPREVREELGRAGLPESLWKEVVTLARPSLTYLRPRYYYTPFGDRARAALAQQRDLHRAVRQLVRAHRAAAAQLERREQQRVDFIQPVRVFTEDGREFTLLTRDLSPTGIRLIGTRRLLGQKVRVLIPVADGEPWDFVVRVLWTCPVGEDLVENGGTLLEVHKPSS